MAGNTHGRVSPWSLAMRWLVLAGWCVVGSGTAWAETIVLKNGMQLEGTLGSIEGLRSPVPGAFGAGDSNNIKSVVVVDDGLRRTFVPALQVSAVPGGGKKEVKIRIDQRVAEGGFAVNTVGPIIDIKPFDEWGRRTFSMSGGRTGRTDVVQGITEVTPLYTRVQGLSATTSYVWDMRIATSSIPRETLSRILRRIDPESSAHRLQIVALYIEADRIQDARVELEEVVDDFPKLAGLKDQVDTLRQIGAQRLIKEIKQRKEAGQHRMAYAMAAEFPVEGIAGATLLSIRDTNTEYEDQKKQYDATLVELSAQLEKIDDEELRGKLMPFCEEIARDLNINTMDRMADFIRLADDEKLTPDQKVALALSGWILGSGAGTENTAVAMSLGQVRDLVRDYLSSQRKPERSDILYKLTALEGSSPAYLAKIIANMKPPLDPPQPPMDEPGIPGLFEITVPGVGEDGEFTYHVQLPPEYDPYRRYPCILTLNAAGTTPEQQIDWWAGAYSEKLHGRLGQATRQGYIVLAPKWTKEHQQSYEYSSREHAAVLFSLRDALQKFAIDTDHIFLSGHSLGGDAAWDIGLAHPDLWAGVIPITANAAKFVTLYDNNARYVPLFFVVGEKDGKRSAENLTQWDHYLERSGHDVMVAEYLGRGHEHFYDEIQRLFEWMKLHRRDFFPKEFEVVTVREWDNFFWFIEIEDFPPKMVISPLSWSQRSRNTPAVRVEVRITPNNGLNVQTGARHGAVFVSPEILDFEKKINLVIPGRSRRQPEASSEVLLEDVRTRGDRQHPFWAKVEF